jgi:sugar lactone lactonase YvrE
VRTFAADRDVSPKRGFFKKVLDVVAGAPDRRQTIRPYGIAIDSRGRAIVTDPGAMGIHIFDFADHKYKFIARNDKDENSMKSPQCVAVDAQDNFYVTDSETGRILFSRREESLSGSSAI